MNCEAPEQSAAGPTRKLMTVRFAMAAGSGSTGWSIRRGHGEF